MANLVSPGYRQDALINEILAATEERTLEFKGLNRRDYVEEGEMSDMKNLTSDNYPLLTPRRPRGMYELPDNVTVPYHIMARYNKLAMIAKYTYEDEDEEEQEAIGFFFDGELVEDVVGLTETTDLVAINTKICFFPQKSYVEVLQSGTSVVIKDNSFGYLGLELTLSNASVDASNTEALLTIPALEAGESIGYDDAVDIHITSYTPSGGSATATSFDISAAVEDYLPDTNQLVLPRETFIEMTGEGVTEFTITGTLKRNVPDMDMVMEWNNRLWGASSKENTIYACKLGDPKNWSYFQGTSLDSYYAQQGTDGMWTGCGQYSSHIIFFKQNGMARIYGTAPSNFQITSTKCYGVEEGSRGSVVTINDRIFYKSVIGIMCYEGGTPYCISEKFNYEFKNVMGGSEGRKYYASIVTKDVGAELMVLDTERGVWHKEDNLKMQDTCNIDDKMYFITHDSEAITCSNDILADGYLLVGTGEPTEGIVNEVNADIPTEDEFEWSATFGPFDEFIENRKIYSKLMLRLIREADSQVDVYISINQGPWEQVYSFDPAVTGGDYIPIIPRRCDRYSIKIVGRGDCKIKSLTRNVRRGTGGRL